MDTTMDHVTDDAGLLVPSSEPLSTLERRDLVVLATALPLLAGLMLTLVRLLPPDPNLWLQAVAGLAVVVLVVTSALMLGLLTGAAVGYHEYHAAVLHGEEPAPARARWARTALVGTTLPLDVARSILTP